VKSIEAICVTSTYSERKKILFSEETGLIVDVTTPDGKADYIYPDHCRLFSGMGDVHIHAREDVSQKNSYKEDFLSAKSSMLNGGVTHAGDMPNNPIPPLDDKSYLSKLKLMEKTDGCLWPYAGVGPKTGPLSFSVPYKVYMGPSIGELFFKDFSSLDEALSQYKNQWVSFHCEDPEILEKSKNNPDHLSRRPTLAEAVATRDALYFIEKYNLIGKLCHFSSGEGLNLVREARRKGLKVFLEATPQHLYFDQSNIPDDKKNYFQMNPPIRFEADRRELLKAFMSGEIDFLATDHAPHTMEEKEKGMSGLTGLDTFAPFVTWLLDMGVSENLIAKTCSENPGLFFNQFLETFKKHSKAYLGLGKGVGILEKDFAANFTILNLSRPTTISKDRLKTKVQHSPFEGVTFPGSLEAVFLRGKLV
jgi:dihydroorotase